MSSFVTNSFDKLESHIAIPACRLLYGLSKLVDTAEHTLITFLQWFGVRNEFPLIQR